jgi:futalosine hydrolase
LAAVGKITRSREAGGSVARVILVVAATEPELRGADGARTLVCGVGPVEAAAATGRALAAERPTALLHVGVAGARRGCGIEVPAVVIGSEAVYSDLSTRLAPRRVLPDAALVAAARRALPDAAVVPIATSASVGGGSDCQVEAMEGFAVLRAAALAAVPAVEVRAVSNEVEEVDRARWRLDDALAALAEAVPRLLAELER